MKAGETEVHDIITYTSERCVVRAVNNEFITVFNTHRQETQSISSLQYVVMVERPRKLIPKGREFRVYRIQKQQCGTGGRKVIAARGLTYPEAEAFRDEQPKSDEFYFLVCNGKIKPNQW